MLTGNPYLSLSEERATERNSFSAENLPLVLTTPRMVLMIAGAFSSLFAAIAVASLIFFKFGAVTAFAEATVFGFCSYAAATAFFTTVTITRSGISMRGLHNYSYEWNEIISWQRNELGLGGLGVSFVGKDGKTVFVSNLAVMSKSHSATIVAAFSHFLGSQGNTNVG